jgi:hypothetical protein
MTGPAPAHRMLWLPRSLQAARGPAPDSPRLTGHQILIYLALLDRADNRTGTYTLDTAKVAQAAGVNPATVRAAIGVLATAGLLEVLRSGRGTHARVLVTRGVATASLRIPVAVIWPDRGGAPRWPHRDAGLAVRALLAIEGVVDYRTRRTEQTWQEIATAADWSRTEFARGLAVLLGAAADSSAGQRTVLGGWLTSTSRTRPRHGGGTPMRIASLLTLDWTRLPLQNAGISDSEDAGIPDPVEAGIPDPDNEEIRDPEDARIPDTLPSGTACRADTSSTTPATTGHSSSAAGISSSDGGGGGLLHESSGNGDAVVLSMDARRGASSKSLKSSSSESADVPAQRQRPQPTAEQQRTTDIIRTVMSGRTAADDALRAAVDAVGGERESLDDAAWTAVVVANIAHADGGRALPLTPAEALDLVGDIVGLRGLGWDALEAASRLTVGSGAGVRSAFALLRARRIPTLRKAPVGVTHSASDAAVWLPLPQTTSPSGSKPLRAVYQRKDPSVYRQSSI